MAVETVCVIGSASFLASWLVKLLLSKGYKVHGTVRNPDDEKNSHLKKLEGASENLKLFKADVLDYGSLAAAIKGCVGVFHAASPVPSDASPLPGVKAADPQKEVVEPTVTGTLNVLKACFEARVKRVVYVSSMASVLYNPTWPSDKAVDEDCWSDADFCRDVLQNWYCVSKTIAEVEAVKLAEKNGLDVVTLNPVVVIGPMLQSNVNTSSLFLISFIKEGFEVMENQVLWYVDVRDVAEALLLLYTKPEAKGRYICSSHAIKSRDFKEKLKAMYPHYNYPKNAVYYGKTMYKGFIDVEREAKISSEKLKSLGWTHRSLEESIVDSIEFYEGADLLKKD
ncbi:Cinnamoyl-CoA reductase 1 [Acorus calamus]|uniref:Cinnamoyl-CoA reductase 1 n=1 Tax=Acorus calamus TaxID=4465 RepID=A0AAV9BZG5_ACOCL|nr:Cinnamoyl-CoA reductase 1 [Acorus calamus]